MGIKSDKWTHRLLCPFRGSLELCISTWPGSCRNPASASFVLGLQTHTTTPGSQSFYFLPNYVFIVRVQAHACQLEWRSKDNFLESLPLHILSRQGLSRFCPCYVLQDGWPSSLCYRSAGIMDAHYILLFYVGSEVKLHYQDCMASALPFRVILATPNRLFQRGISHFTRGWNHSAVVENIHARALGSIHGPENNPKPKPPHQNPTEFLEVFCTCRQEAFIFRCQGSFHLIETYHRVLV